MLMSGGFTAKDVDTLTTIKQDVQQSMTYVTDQDKWHMSDYWESDQVLLPTVLNNKRIATDCLIGSTKVLTNKGWQSMYSLALDYSPGVLNHTYIVHGKECLGTGAFFKGRLPVLNVELSNGLSLRGTADHRVRIVQCRNNSLPCELQWKTIGELVENDKVHLHTTEQYDGPVERSQAFFDGFFMGLLMGDGSTNESLDGAASPKLILYHEKAVLADYLIAANLATSAEPTGSHGVPGVQIRWTHRARELLFARNFFNKSSVVLTSREEFLGYLSGLIATDGTVYGKNGDINIRGGRSYLINLAYHLLHYGYSDFSFTVERLEGTVTNLGIHRKDLCRLMVRAKTTRRLNGLLLLREPQMLELEKLKEVGSRDTRQSYAKVRSISYGGRVPVYDITVPETSSFIAEGVEVHNCEEMAMVSMRKAIDAGYKARLIICLDEIKEGHCICEVVSADGTQAYYFDNRRLGISTQQGLTGYFFYSGSPWNPQPGDQRPWVLINKQAS